MYRLPKIHSDYLTDKCSQEANTSLAMERNIYQEYDMFHIKLFRNCFFNKEKNYLRLTKSVQPYQQKQNLTIIITIIVIIVIRIIIIIIVFYSRNGLNHINTKLNAHLSMVWPVREVFQVCKRSLSGEKLTNSVISNYH